MECLICFRRFLARQDAANGEEAGLHDGVDAAAHAGVFRHLVGIDDVELDLLFNQVLLHIARQGIPNLFGTVDAVHQEDRTRAGELEHVKTIHKAHLVAANEVGFAIGDQVGSVDGLGTEAQVRNGNRAGFLRVVLKVTLGIIGGLITDDLDRVLVRADGAV